MAKTMEREKILAALRGRIAAGKALVGFGAGCGMTAKSAEAGGADFISIYTTAACRIEGTPSILAWLPYGNVNEEMRGLSAKILPLIQNTPCVAGLGVHDPRIEICALVDEFIAMGYSGVSNEPFCSTYGPEFCRLLNEAGIGFSREVELIRTASEMNVFTLAWAANETETIALTQAGADVIGILAGLPRLLQEEDEAYISRVMRHVSAVNYAARRENSNIITLAHGGPINTVAMARRAQRETGVDGCATGSGGERIPVERAIMDVTKAYRAPTGERNKGENRYVY